MSKRTEVNREDRIKRLLYQSWYRGCKETDKLLGYFARANLARFDDVDLDAFEAILLESDRDLFDWLTEKKPLPPHYVNHPVMTRLMKFNVAHYVQNTGKESPTS